jgi:hypothetical protein
MWPGFHKIYGCLTGRNFILKKGKNGFIAPGALAGGLFAHCRSKIVFLLNSGHIVGGGGGRGGVRHEVKASILHNFMLQVFK